MTPLRAIHTVASLRADHGGPARSITSLCSALASQGLTTDLVTVGQRVGEEAPILPQAPGVRVHLVNGVHSSRLLQATNAEFTKRIAGVAAGSSLVVLHDHGVWLATNHAAAIAARKGRFSRVVSPRGMLSTWALNFHKWKKRVAWAAYQGRDLRTTQMIHVTSSEEAAEVRKLQLRQPLTIIPNGVEVPAVVDQQLTRDRPRTALFLSRIHPKKGVLELVTAWARVRPVHWRLIIAGPDDGGHRQTVESLVRSEGLIDHVQFIGSVADADKWELYSRADLFVLPTFSENFGIVVAEALAAGVPAITTKGAPWRALEEHACGWWIDVGVEALVQALREATSLSETARRSMGARGRAYVEGELSWERIAREMLAAYEWLIFGGTMPPSVVTD